MVKDEKKTAAWMWAAGGATMGLMIDKEDGEVEWHGQIGCHCGDEDTTFQSLESFRQNGPLPFIGPLPADIRQEVDSFLAG